MRAGLVMVVVSAVLSLGGCASAPERRPTTDALQLRKELARSLVAHGEYVAASRPLLELEALTPLDADVRVMLADVYREQGLHDQAEREYIAALGLSPDHAGALGGLAVLRELRGDPGDGALVTLRRAIELEPNNPAHHNNLGFALYIRGSFHEAVQAYQEALRLDPANPRIRNNLGFAYGRLGDVPRARREFTRAVGPASAENNIGLLQELSGDMLAACGSYRDAIALDGSLKVAFVNAQRACACAESQMARSAP